jgi:hypothetical protein
LLATETNKLRQPLVFYNLEQKYAVIKLNASAIVVLVGTTVSCPQTIGSPVYTTHCASNTSEHGCAVGHPSGVGHGGGVVRYESLHPHSI